MIIDHTVIVIVMAIVSVALLENEEIYITVFVSTSLETADFYVNALTPHPSLG